MSRSHIEDRADFIDRQASEKNTLATLEATTRLINWNLVAGGLYSRIVEHYVVNLHDCVTDLVEVSDEASVVPGTWYFNPKNNELLLNLLSDSDPNLTEMVATYRFFFGDNNMTASHDVTDTGYHVFYEGRIASAPGYNHKIGYEQNLTSIVGQGSLKLHNQDGGLDDIFDRYFFENQNVKVYSWNRQLKFSEAQIIYRGRVTNKSFDLDTITFTVKDPLYDLDQPVPTGIFTEADNVDSSLLGKSKRWVYGRVDGLRAQPLDKIGDGFLISGTASIQSSSNELSGTGTSFLTEVTPNDKIVIATEQYTIDRVLSDTEITLTSIARNGFTNQEILLKPNTSPVYKNRNYQLTSHACSESVATVIETTFLNRIVVDTTTGFFAGDLIEVGSTNEKIEIKNIAPGNVIVLKQAILIKPLSGDTLRRIAVQDVYHDGVELLEEDFTINNTVNGCFITLSEDAEINVAPSISSDVQLIFVGGSRYVQVVGDFDTIKSILSVNNLIRSSNITYTKYYSIIDIDELTSTQIDYVDFVNSNFPVDDYNGITNFPVTGSAGRVYNDFLADQLYTWNGSNYVQISDIYESPATNYHTTSRVYIKDSDAYKYDVGMSITIQTNGTEHTSDILFVNKVTGDSYVDLVTAYTQPFEPGDSIDEINVIALREPTTEASTLSTFDYKVPNFIDDSAIVSVDILGKTKDGTTIGEWIKTGSEAVLDICKSVNITNFNIPKFDEASIEAGQLLSLTIPQTNNAKQQKAIAAINLINRTIIGSLNMDNDLDLQYRIIQPNIDEAAIPEVMDCDLINWSVKTVNGKVIQSVGVDYRHMDYDKVAKQKGSFNVEYAYPFVDKYIGTTARADLDAYLYEKFDAEIRGHREAYYRSLSRADITLNSDLRLEGLAIGDSIVLDLQRLYRRLGDNYRKKVVMIVGKRVTGNRITFFCTDFGNIYNRSNIITRNDAPCYGDATRDEKLKLGFITDNRGIVDDNEDTNNNHLIS